MDATTFSYSEIHKCKSLSGIYSIRGKYNDFNLVGQTTRAMSKRWTEHVTLALKGEHENPYFQRSFNKHGIENFEFIVREEISDLSLLDSRESDWIALLDSMKGHRGWNMREGGAHGNYGSDLRKRVSDGIRRSKKAMESRWAQRKTYTLRDPRGNLVTFTGMRKFCRENGIRNSGAIYKLLNGKATHARGWTLPNIPIYPTTDLALTNKVADELTDLQRKCPTCGSTIDYTQKCHKHDAEKKKKLCRSCAAKIVRERIRKKLYAAKA